MTQADTVCARGRRAREEQRRAEARAAAGQRSGEGSDAADGPLHNLSSQICHELRTPLNAVIGFSELMRRELFGPVGNARYREYLDHINDSAKRMLQAAEETLAFATLLSAPAKPAREELFDLNEAITTAVQLAGKRRGAERPAASVFVDSPVSAEVWADRTTLPYALAHLICASHHISHCDQVRLSCLEAGQIVTVRVEPLPAMTAAPLPPPTIDSSDSDLMVMLASALLQSQNLAFTIAQPGADGGRTWFAEVRLESSTQHQLTF